MGIPVVIFLPKVIDEVIPYLRSSKTLLNIGAGTCDIDATLAKKGFNVTSLDVKNTSSIREIDPIIYDGKSMPFKDKQFDTALIFFVLHHIKNPEEVLKEAKRVSHKILIREDLYNNDLQRRALFFIDSLLSFEFSSHPHSNKTNDGWHKTFDKLGLRILEEKGGPNMIYAETVTYLLDAD